MDPHQILSIEMLQYVYVNSCERLTSLFPASLAKDIVNLEQLYVRNCKKLVEIVEMDEFANSKGAVKEFVFPHMTSLTLGELPELKYFYNGPHEINWPSLKVLDVYECNMLKIFAYESQSHCEAQAEDRVGCEVHQQALVTVEKAFPNLEFLSINKEDSMMICHQQFQENLLHSLKFLSLHRFDEEDGSVILPFEFLENVPNIEELKLAISGFKEIFSSERHDVDCTRFLPKLKTLRLLFLPFLNSTGFEHSWVDPIPKNLEILHVIRCISLITLAPSKVSFCNLTELTVYHCDKLIHLFTSSTAKSLARLNQMSVTECESIDEIVSKGEDESNEDEIIFEQLRTLNFEKLPRLKSFYDGSCSLSFPCLIQVNIFKCLGMKVFSQVDVSSPNLSGVYFRRAEMRKGADLNTIILTEKVAIVQHLKLDAHPELNGIWHGVNPIPQGCFSNLMSLVIVGCELLSVAIPSHVLPTLYKLEKIKVGNSKSITAIFDVKEEARNTMINLGFTYPLSFSLKKLTLEGLPNLEHVWNMDLHQILSIEMLQYVHVDSCERLTSLFPAPMAKDIVNLKQLDVANCKKLVEIVEMDELANLEGAVKEFVFPHMTYLRLWELPELKYFYNGPHEINWPSLTELHVYECNELKIFTYESQSHCEAQTEDQVGSKVHQQALVTVEKVPNIEELWLGASGFKEIFSSERPNVDCTRLPSKLKMLRLFNLPVLNSIGFEHSWVDPIPKNLEILQVDECVSLMTLAPSTVSFCNLTELTVARCDKLVHLFTSSTAKSLVQLHQMFVTECKSIEEIVSKGEDESDEDEIVFDQLWTLSLESLPSLKSFYNGSSALKFLSLEQVSVIQCPQMEKFSQGDIFAPDEVLGNLTRRVFNEET